MHKLDDKHKTLVSRIMSAPNWIFHFNECIQQVLTWIQEYNTQLVRYFEDYDISFSQIDTLRGDLKQVVECYRKNDWQQMLFHSSRLVSTYRSISTNERFWRGFGRQVDLSKKCTQTMKDIETKFVVLRRSSNV